MTALSAHFTWAEVEHSDTAIRRGIPNLVPETLRENAAATAAHMERVREVLGGHPLTVHSWYRSPSVNRAIGGSRISAHMRALAVDFDPTGQSLHEAFEILAESDIPFDQLIEERTRDGADWIHIGFVEGTPRREVFRAEGDRLGGPMTYRRVWKS